MPHEKPDPQELRREIARLQALLKETEGGDLTPELVDEDPFYALTQSVSAAIFIVQGDRFLYMNPAGEELCGYTLEELRSRPFWEIIHPEDRDMVRERGLARQEGQEVPPSYEFRIVTKDGQERWARLHRRGHSPTGASRPSWAPPLTSPSTSRPRRRSRSRASSLADIINFLPDPTFAINRQGEVIVWNRAIEELTRDKGERHPGQGRLRARPALLGRAPSHPGRPGHGVGPDLRGAATPMCSARGTPCAPRPSLPPIPPAGAQLWGKATALFDSQGEIVGAIETVRDITKRTAMEEALRASAAKHKALVQSLPVGMISVDPDFRITEINSQGEKILGYSQAEVLGRPCGEVLQGRGVPRPLPHPGGPEPGTAHRAHRHHVFRTRDGARQRDGAPERASGSTTRRATWWAGWRSSRTSPS